MMWQAWVPRALLQACSAAGRRWRRPATRRLPALPSLELTQPPLLPRPSGLCPSTRRPT